MRIKRQRLNSAVTTRSAPTGCSTVGGKRHPLPKIEERPIHIGHIMATEKFSKDAARVDRPPTGSGAVRKADFMK